ncbi:MAG: histidinol phosphate phosphatase [Deltaproteobacteria bacterium HGW-Deltaproteobacteria-14]|nr:MAG: histidinol phosphate phosphatase [Deltaproteobacteria bacterium HGW-Deltaproteobacteria-14]
MAPHPIPERSTVSIPSLATLLEVATEVAWAGGRRTLAWFQSGLRADTKADGSPVTVADREAEQVMRDLILARFPDHQIVGEEHGTGGGTAPVRWILDPIDGTRTFVRGVPLYGTLVGVEVEGEPSVGVIYMPALDEMVAAARGLGCRWNGRPCHVSDRADAGGALLVATDLDAVRRRVGNARADALVDRVDMQRTWADCYGYLLVATGRADVAMDAEMAIWDCAALMPIIEEAGGRFTAWTGARSIDGGDAVATNGRLHDEVLDLLGVR